MTVSSRSEEHTSELQSHSDLVCRLLLEKYPKTRERIEAAQIEKYGFYNRKKGDETEEINVLLPQ